MNFLMSHLNFGTECAKNKFKVVDIGDALALSPLPHRVGTNTRVFTQLLVCQATPHHFVVNEPDGRVVVNVIADVAG